MTRVIMGGHDHSAVRGTSKDWHPLFLQQTSPCCLRFAQAVSGSCTSSVVPCTTPDWRTGLWCVAPVLCFPRWCATYPTWEAQHGSHKHTWVGGKHSTAATAHSPVLRSGVQGTTLLLIDNDRQNKHGRCVHSPKLHHALYKVVCHLPMCCAKCCAQSCSLCVSHYVTG
jgi:hypothetical protein